MKKIELASPITLKDEVRWFAESFDLPDEEQQRLMRGLESAFTDGLKSGFRQGFERAAA